ncbi:hypothetical protein B0H14DRAFT_3445852 [Mycena olivaceomarginata]|nr:hypothetical protein B0H14DRAFT_3445852 [Mycena olivaceomarginata]
MRVLPASVGEGGVDLKGRDWVRRPQNDITAAGHRVPKRSYAEAARAEHIPSPSLCERASRQHVCSVNTCAGAAVHVVGRLVGGMGAGAVSARAVPCYDGWRAELSVPRWGDLGGHHGGDEERGKVELEIDVKETEVERGGMDRLVYREDATISSGAWLRIKYASARAP